MADTIYNNKVKIVRLKNFLTYKTKKSILLSSYNTSRHGLQRGWKYLKLNDTKNTFTSTGKLNEVEQKITGKKYGIFYCWTRDSANIEG